MKKILTYISILIITFVTIFNFGFNTNVAQAVDCISVNRGESSPTGCTPPAGSCYDANNNPQSDLTWRQCKINTGYKWTTTSPGPATPNPAGGFRPGTPGTGGIPLNICNNIDPAKATNKPCGKQLTSDEVNTNYVLLAPLPCPEGTLNCDKNGQLTTYNFGGNTPIGSYLNIMIRIFIGLCAVLAMVMIVVGGVEYMMSELISSKESGKQKITGAVFGLILALSSWALLNTINPDLLTADPTIENVLVTVELQDEIELTPPSLSPYGGTLPSGSLGLCAEGVIQSKQNNIVSCKNISANIDKMVADAKQAGLIIWGGGFRTTSEQTALRIKNCNGNTNDKKIKCTPPTATVGSSRHENGLAIDIACNGQTITSTNNNCFKWLQINAGNYGLRNLPSEPWHWSIDGR